MPYTDVGGEYNASLPTVSDGKSRTLQLDSSGRLITTGSGGTTDTLIGAITETAPATDTASSGLNGRLQRIAQRLTSLIALLPTSLGATTGGLKVEAGSYASSNTLTRTADTTAYTGGDVLGINNAGSPGAAALTFASIGPSGGGEVLITSVSLQVNLSAVPSGMTSFRLHLYSVTPPSALLDNAAWDLPSGDRASYIGYVDLGTPVDVGSTLYVKTDSVNMQLTLASGSVFGYLVTNGGYTPTSGEVYVIKLHSAGF